MSTHDDRELRLVQFDLSNLKMMLIREPGKLLQKT